MKDRAMQALYLLALDPIAETTGDHNSYGFRKERSPADAIAQCFQCFRQKTSSTVILEADIRSCFDEISHEWLLAHIPMDKRILKQWLKAGYIERKTFHHTEAGTPQGGIASPVLANLTLDGLEALIDRLPHRGTKRQAKLHLVRFADDFIVTGSSRELLGEDIQPGIVEFLAERGLGLSAEKTRLVSIDEGFDFLGQNIRKYKGKLLIKPAAKSIKRFLRKVRTIIKTNPTISAGELIAWLNPVIRGWANYHRHVVSKKVFSRVDHFIHQALWQWARRRHRDKGAHWIRAKYFAPDWTFRGTKQGRDGRHKTITLVKAARIPIRRHVKVRAAANPYHPQWEHYFEKRRERMMSDYLSANPVVLRLWLKQNGICPMCNTPISKETGWENHHIKWRVYGGSDRMDNRVLLHPNCHRQVHSLGLTVLQPRPAKGR
jgi:RNA-directed DNA polymerase